MKHWFISGMLVILFYTGLAQSGTNGIDNKMRSISAKDAFSTASIAAYINASFNKEHDKIRAAYTWVITNIEYDTDSMYAINWNMGGKLKVSESFRRRKGVCENFAGIFIDIITQVGLKGVTIDGYTKQGNTIDKTGHTWCAVQIDNEWLLFDPTWDKDRPNDPYYFMQPPSVFAGSHMPFDPIWQLTDEPVSHREFQNRGGKKSDIKINHKDSIKAFMRLGELGKLEAIARRMERSDKITELIKNQIAYIRMEIGVIYGEKDMELYNAAVNDLNAATKFYNAFIQTSNSLTLEADKEVQFNKTLLPALILIQRAMQSITGIGKVFPNYQYDITALKARLEEMEEKIGLQKPGKN